MEKTLQKEQEWIENQLRKERKKMEEEKIQERFNFLARERERSHRREYGGETE